MRMQLKDIQIKDTFLDTTPRSSKVEACREYFKKNHYQDKPIVVDANNVLVDGYIRYLVLKENGVEMADVKVVRRRKTIADYRTTPTTYIYGVHTRRKQGSSYFSKEYVWRVPNKLSGFEDNLLPGDKIIVNTRRGGKVVTVTQIKRLNESPVSLPVKTVFGRVM